MAVIPHEPQPEEVGVASTAVSQPLVFDPDARERIVEICLRDLIRARPGKGDLILTMVPQGFGSRLVAHVNVATREALANAR